MPKISGREVLSESTEKSQTRLFLVATIAIIAKSYELPVSEIKMMGMDFPSAIFDVSLLALLGWYAYSYLLKWIADLLAFRLWYAESSIWSEFGTILKIDREFIWGGADAIRSFHGLNMASVDLQTFDEKKRKLYEDFVTNIDLYIARLEHGGNKFKAISLFGHFYVWFQGFVLPVILTIIAAYLTIKYGTFQLPNRY